jgi:hypothetical protein
MAFEEADGDVRVVRAGTPPGPHPATAGEGQ